MYRMNLRQEATRVARDLSGFSNLDPSACPVGDVEGRVLGKAARAILIDKVTEIATGGACPKVDRISHAQTPHDTFSVLAGGVLSVSFRSAFDEMVESCPGVDSGIYRTGLADDETDIREFLARFSETGVRFTSAMLQLATLALPQMKPEEIYSVVGSSYSGMAKKITGGGPRFKLSLVLEAMESWPSALTGEVELNTIGLRTMPSIKLSSLMQFPESLIEELAERSALEPLSALCPASIKVREGEVTAAERVWRWTVAVAQNSGLIERIGELEEA